MDLRLRSNAASRQNDQSGCYLNLFTAPKAEKPNPLRALQCNGLPLRKCLKINECNEVTV